MSPFLAMLLASIGPLLVGFTNLGDDTPDTEDEDAAPEETADDPIEMIDVATFIENARGVDDNEGAVNTTRGTDQDATFEAGADAAARHDASGGNDTLVGNVLNDTLSGGDGSDLVQGGDGDDALFGAFDRATRPDDEASDTLVGGAGNDTLFMGDGDTGEGGTGRDVFVATQDAVETISISDFNPEEDAIAIETTDPDNTSITDQIVEEGGLSIELSTGLSLRLEGVAAPVDASVVQFVSVAQLADS